MFRARAIVLALIAGGCGRIGFGVIAAGDASMVDAVDAAPDPCAIPTTAPDPLMLTGVTVEPTSFNGSSFITEPGTMLTVTDAGTNAVLGQTFSDTSATYNLAIATGGQPVHVVMTFTKAGYNPTTAVFARPLTDNLDLDASLLSNSDVASVYLAAGQTMTTGGAFVAVVSDCSGNLALDATDSTSPASTIVYTDMNGQPDVAVTSGPYGYGFNLPVGNVQLTANEGGAPRAVIEVPIVAGALTTAIISPIE